MAIEHALWSGCGHTGKQGGMENIFPLSVVCEEEQDFKARVCSLSVKTLRSVERVENDKIPHLPRVTL